MSVLFGWITKPHILWSVIDSIMAFVEIMGLMILVFVIYVLIVVIQDKFNDKGDK